MRYDRRQFLAATAGVGAVALAGCSGDDEGGSDDGTDTGEDDSSGNGTDTESADGSVTFDVDGRGGMTVGFDELVISFDAFELRSEGETVRREGGGTEFDLTGGETGDLLETQVPAGEYTEGAFFMPVVDYQVAADSEDLGGFEGNDPAVVELGVDGPLELTEGSSRVFELQINIRQGPEGTSWAFNVGYASY